MSDVYTTITTKIIEQLAAVNPSNYILPWHKKGAQGSARNFISKVEYNGINRLLLDIFQNVFGFSSSQWGTYKQWQEHGAQVRKSEKGSPIIYYSQIRFEDADTGEEATRGFLKGYTVFNADQVDGYEATETASPAQVNQDGRLNHAEAFFKKMGSKIYYGGDKAFYMPATDSITVPAFEQFRDATAYYSVLAHEHTHWTGSKSRLNRELKGYKQDPKAYAFEELIAELGASFVCDFLGLANEPRIDHAQYLAAWLKILKEDKRAIFRAATQAQKAVDFMKNVAK
jgi:antirestriction protein ArdC